MEQSEMTGQNSSQYYLYVLQCIEQGEKDIEDGNILTHEEVENRLAGWLK